MLLLRVCRFFFLLQGIDHILQSLLCGSFILRIYGSEVIDLARYIFTAALGYIFEFVACTEVKDDIAVDKLQHFGGLGILCQLTVEGYIVYAGTDDLLTEEAHGFGDQSGHLRIGDTAQNQHATGGEGVTAGDVVFLLLIQLGQRENAVHSIHAAQLRVGKHHGGHSEHGVTGGELGDLGRAAVLHEGNRLITEDVMEGEKI